MKKEGLKNKVWYRFIKIIFILFFITTQFYLMSEAVNYSAESKISDASYVEVGKTLRQLTSENSELNKVYSYLTDPSSPRDYSNYSDGELGRWYIDSRDSFSLFLLKNSLLQERKIELDQILSTINQKVDNLIKYQKVYSVKNVVLMFIVFELIILFAFWLVSKLFIYILTGEFKLNL